MLIQSNIQRCTISLFTTRSINTLMLILTLTFCSSIASAQAGAYAGSSDEDTILIEDQASLGDKQTSQKIPYHRILKAFAKRLFDVDMESVFSGGKNKRTAVVRHFSEYTDRTKYRVKVKKDEVVLKFSLNF